MICRWTDLLIHLITHNYLILDVKSITGFIELTQFDINRIPKRGFLEYCLQLTIFPLIHKSWNEFMSNEFMSSDFEKLYPIWIDINSPKTHINLYTVDFHWVATESLECVRFVCIQRCGRVLYAWAVVVAFTRTLSV